MHSRLAVMVTMLALAVAAVPLSEAHNGPARAMYFCGPLEGDGACDFGVHTVVNPQFWMLLGNNLRGNISMHEDLLSPIDGSIVSRYTYACTVEDQWASCIEDGIYVPRGGPLHIWCDARPTTGQWGCYFEHG